VARIKWYEKK